MTLDSNRDKHNNPSSILLKPDTLVGHYRIIARIGTGGMGEVYRAEDIDLGRDVALKFLPRHLCQDSDCRKRFSREAQASARLNHANIVTIFEVNEFESIPYFAMEYIDGEPLSNLIERKEITTDRAIEIAIQVCDALNEAHSKGIIHRDIKPSNILIDTSGRAKLSDFGLATIKGTDRLTRDTSTIGTVYYMSPEQARGEELDQRSDLFSLGAVFYEMLTGQLAFSGKHEPSVIYSIVNEEPEPLSKYIDTNLEQLQRVINKSLAKKADDRYLTATELIGDLYGLTGNVYTPRSWPRKKVAIPKLNSSYLIAIGSLILIIAAAFYWARLTHKSLPPSYMQITRAGSADICAISPDGKQVVFSQKNSNSLISERTLMIKELIGGESSRLVDLDNIEDLRWSPDGTEIAFTGTMNNQGGVYVIPRLGGKPRQFFRCMGTPDYAQNYGTVAWSPDGSRLIFHTIDITEFIIIDYITGNHTAFYPKNGLEADWIYGVDWSSDESYILVSGAYRSDDMLWVVSLKDSLATLISGLPSQIKYPRWGKTNNRIYFLSYNDSPCLMRLNIRTGSPSESGDLTTLINGLLTEGPISISADNKMIIYPLQLSWANLWTTVLDSAGNTINRQLTFNKWPIGGVAISPDGHEVIYGAIGESGLQIYLVSIEGGKPTQITRNGGKRPVWSPDGNRIAFTHPDTPNVCLAIINREGASFHNYPGSLQSDDTDDKEWISESEIIYQLPGNRNFETLNLETGMTKKLLDDDSLGWAFGVCISPDKSKFALFLNRSFSSNSAREKNYSLLPVPDSIKAINGRLEARGIWIISKEDNVMVPLCWTESGTFVLGWSRDGNWVYFCPGGDKIIYKINISNHTIKKVATLAAIPGYEIEMMPDENGFVYSVSENFRDLWMVENFDPDVK
jgi:Tol biopolymer transport system component